MLTLKSELDASVNIVLVAPDGGKYEARFVQCRPDYYVCYLSTQSGCAHSCRMCHLTATKQTMDLDASVYDLRDQARRVMFHADKVALEAETVHFNFMARGEPLASEVIKRDWPHVSAFLRTEAWERRLRPMYLISTILPKSLGSTKLIDIFGRDYPEIYWSLYTVDPSVRRRWLPQAMSVDKAAAKLKEWQDATNKIPKIHFAFISKMNATGGDIAGIVDLLERHKLIVNFNIVRYNPPNERSCELSEHWIGVRATQLRMAFPQSRVDIVDRVGFDVKASCGMFVGGKE